MSIDISIRRIPLNREGYEYGKYGQYYGAGAPLYHYELYNSETGEEETGETRAGSNKDVRDWLKSKYPHFFFQKKSNPPLSKWIPAKAIKFNQNGSVSLKK